MGEYTSEAEVPELTYDKKPALTTGPSGSVTESSAIVTCEYRYTAFWSEKIGVEFSDGAGNRHEMVQDVTEDGTYSFQLTGLQPETTYTYRAFAIIDGKHFYADNPKSFVTSKGIDVKDIEFEITPTFKESAPSTEEGPRYLKFWYEVSTNDIKKIQGVSRWGTILYQNGVPYDTYTATKNDWSFNVLRCYEPDLSIHNSTYTAVADKATYAISIFVEHTNSSGETVFETTEPKPIEAPTYTKKPEIVISSIEAHDEIIGEWDDDNGVHHIQKQLHYVLKYRAEGLFWVEPITEFREGINLIHPCPVTESYHTYAAGPGYYDNQRPQTVSIMAKDLTTGQMITSMVNIP